MNKVKAVLVICFVCGVMGSAQARTEEVTLVMVPRTEPAVQLGMDLANRYPTLLISYLVAANGAVSLHGWTGTQWVNIKPEDFKAGSFFKTGPNSALIIGDERQAVSEDLIPPEEWCSDVSRITTTQVRPLIHLVGQYYNFEFKDWQWFSKRYNQSIDAINPEGLNVAWYHKRLNENLQESGQLGSSDLQYWVSIRQSTISEEPVSEDVEPLGMEEIFEEESGNPLTNAVPTAVIMGAGDVPEEYTTEPVLTESTNTVSESADEM